MTDLAWHFTNGKLRDGSDIPPNGEWLHFNGEPKLWVRGLHASRRVIDALEYATGQTVHRVVVKGIAEEELNNRLVASTRLVLWRHELPDELLKAIARECALSVIDHWDAPSIVRKYLETGDEELRDATGTAARAGTRTAAWAAAFAAISDRAWVAARDASWAAAKDAAWAAARDAKREEFNALLEARIREAANSPNDDELLKAIAT